MSIFRWFLVCLSSILPSQALAVDDTWDARINDFIAPFTAFVSKLVFYPLEVFGQSIPFILIWLLVAALFFTLRMGFINIKGFKQAIAIVRGRYDNPSDPGEVTHFQALTAAISGTVGLGNIAGVAIAISIGGPGATFWMILGGFLAMSLKFTECTLAVRYRRFGPDGQVLGGPMYYLQDGLAEKGLPRLGRILAILFAILCIGGALGSGAMFQTNQATQQIVDTLLPFTGGEESPLLGGKWMIGLVFVGAVGLVVVGGLKKIVRVTEVLVPVMAFIYLAASGTIIIAHIDAVPHAFVTIWNGAFAPEGVTGGIVGVMIQGLRRASFSNEAGLGSAAIAHAAAKTKEPIAEGLVALLEPFIDTVVICTMTALVIIISGTYIDAPASLSGISLTSMAFADVISWFPYVLSVAVVLFAYSTSITYFYFGQKSFEYLLGPSSRALRLYQALFLVSILIGSARNLGAVMDFADSMMLAMALPNIIGLYILAPEVKNMLNSYRRRIASNEIKPVSLLDPS